MKSEYSVKEIADLLSVSKPTIQRTIIAAGIEPTTEKSQKRYYDQDKTAQIIGLVSPGFDISEIISPDQTETGTETPTENRHKTDTNQPTQTETDQNKANETAIQALQTALKALQTELDAKNKQIEELHGMIKAFQSLEAGNKQLLLSMQQAKEEPETMEAETAAEPDQEADLDGLDPWGYDIYGKYHGKEPLPEQDHSVIYHPIEHITRPVEQAEQKAMPDPEPEKKGILSFFRGLFK